MHGGTLALLTLIFFVSELVLAIVRHSRQAQGATGADRGSGPVLWVVITLAIFSGFSLANYRPGRIPLPSPWVPTAAFVLLVGGMGFRWWAVVTLGRFFTVDVATHSDHVLIDTGPFRYVRHPSYTGLIAAFLGLGLSTGNWASVIVMMVPILLALAYRIGVEEAALRRALGDPYRSYCARTKRLIPGLF